MASVISHQSSDFQSGLTGGKKNNSNNLCLKNAKAIVYISELS